MLSPITKKIIDHSTEQTFEFSFQCDGCQTLWKSPKLNFSKKDEGLDISVSALLWQVEHDAAYERANQEAIRHFNRCPACGCMVCNSCFVLDAGSGEEDLCRDCAQNIHK